MHAFERQTDGRTHRQTDRQTVVDRVRNAYASQSHGKNTTAVLLRVQRLCVVVQAVRYKRFSDFGLCPKPSPANYVRGIYGINKTTHSTEIQMFLLTVDWSHGDKNLNCT